MSDPPSDLLLLASNNQHKLIEFRRIMDLPGLRIVGPDEQGIKLNVEETGDSLGANARLKALAFSLETTLPVVADDSGLEVDALDGAPGVRSSRFEGLSSDAARNRRLLDKLDGVPAERRTARFRCSIAFARGGELLFEAEAHLRWSDRCSGPGAPRLRLRSAVRARRFRANPLANSAPKPRTGSVTGPGR